MAGSTTLMITNTGITVVITVTDSEGVTIEKCWETGGPVRTEQRPDLAKSSFDRTFSHLMLIGHLSPTSSSYIKRRASIVCC